MRRRLEYVLRGVVVGALAAMLWASSRAPNDTKGDIVSARAVGASELAQWSKAPTAPVRINLQLHSVPSRIERTWLAALAGAGTTVSWRGDLTPLMAAVEPIVEPNGGAIVRVAAPNAVRVVVGDEIGALDSARITRSGATFVLGARLDSVTVSANGSAATAVRRDSVSLRKVLVIGAAGWESKFTAAALEEEGWKVDVFARVAPSVDVTTGPAATIDTSRYAAVVALDASAGPYVARLTAFVRAGGGLILAAPAATTAAMASLRVTGTDAIVLEKRGATPMVSARRVGAGRVIQIAYEDTWRSRMNGSDAAVAEHRRLWNKLVSSVAYAPVVRSGSMAASKGNRSADRYDAPLAALFGALGPASAAAHRAMMPARARLSVILFVGLVAALLAEVASRRVRGVP
jgi:hypothetical protein